MRNSRKQRQYNLIFTTAAFITIMFAIIIAVTLNKKQQAFLSEAQNFTKHVALYMEKTTVYPASTMRVLVYAQQPSDEDWIGLYALTGHDTAALRKQYLKDCLLQTQGRAKVGYCEFVMPNQSGTYVFHLYRDTLFITSAGPISVSATVPTSLTPQKQCTPQPLCLRESPACNLAIPSGGWCPVTN